MSVHPTVRSDLRYVQDPEDETHYTVKDPLRSTFSRFNALQVEMMKRLDGSKSLEEVAREIGEENGFEIPADSIERFRTRLEEAFLLEVDAYRSPPRVHRRVRRILRKKGIVSGGIREPETEEQRLMQAGLRQVETGDPCLAANFFSAVLELNPANAHARFALDTIHDSFFKYHRLIPSHVIMFSLIDADRFLGWLDRKIGWLVFSPFAMLFALVAAMTAGYLALDLRPPEVGPADIAIAWVSGSILWLAVHELGHGLACKHYGGKVDDAGIMMMYGINYGAYCDVSDSYFFEEKRHKIITALAGPYASLLVVSFLTAYIQVTPDGFPLRAVAFTQLLISIFALLQNLIPLVKFDAYYALCDWLDIPNLRERSFRYVAVVLQKSLLGIPADDPEPTPREKVIFPIYGLAAGIFTTFYIFGLVFNFLLPLAERYLGTVGLILAGLYTLMVLKTIIVSPMIRFAGFLFRNRRHLVETQRPLAVLFVACLVVMPLFQPWPLQIDGEARIEPAARGPVYAKAAGIIASIAVKEGDLVRAGDEIARLEDLDLLRERAQVHEQLAAAKLYSKLLEHGARTEELEVARARARQAWIASSFEARGARRANALQREGLLSAEASEHAARRSVVSSEQRKIATYSLAMVRAGHRAEDIAAAQAAVARSQAALEDVERRIANLVLRAPIDGRVVGYRLHERMHERLAEGDLFCEIHDEERVRVEIHLPASEPIDGVAGRPLVARAWGRPSLEISAVVEKVAPTTSDDGSRRTIVQSTPVPANIDWTSGVTGHGRIYGPPRSLAYQWLVRPLVRFVGYDTWRFWG